MSEQRSSFAGDVLKLLAGNAFARVIGWLAFPFVLHLYGAEHVGVWGVFVAIAMIPGAVSCLCYELAIVLPRRDHEAANLLGLSVLLSLLMAGATLAALMAAGGPIAQRLNIPRAYLPLGALCVFATGVNQALTYWATRRGRFGLLAMARGGTDAVIRLAQIGAALAGFRHAGGLIAATIAGYGATFLILSLPVWRADGAFFRSAIRPPMMGAALRRYWKFPLVHAWGRLSMSIASALPRVLLNWLFSPVVAGYFEVAEKLLLRPASLLARALEKVFFQRASQMYARGEDLARMVEEVFRRLAAIAIVPVGVLALVAPDVYALVLPKYVESAAYVVVMCPMLLTAFLCYPFRRLFLVYERQQALLLLDVSVMLSRLGALMLGGYLGSPIQAIWLFSAAATLVNLWLLAWALKLAAASPRRCWRQAAPYLLHAIPLTGLILAAKLGLSLTPVPMVALSALVLAVYMGAVIVRGRLLSPIPT